MKENYKKTGKFDDNILSHREAELFHLNAGSSDIKKLKYINNRINYYKKKLKS